MSWTPDPETLESLHAKFHAELHESVLPFWMRHSLDREHGGYFNCLDRDGKVWDTTKHCWLQGRQVWMLSKLYNTVCREDEILEAARLGADFLRKHARTEGCRVYFSLTRDGRPVSMQRKIFSECFYSMAMAEYARASGDESARKEARDVFEAVWKFANDPALVGRPVHAGTPRSTALAVPMILLNLIDEIHDRDETTYNEIAAWCSAQMDKHIRRDLKLVLEHVGPGGELLATPEGRIVNPGHAIEAGWFLIDYATKHRQKERIQTGIDMIEWSHNFGWDEEHGGLFYFLDREGYSPPALEWHMKLWWPHCEALVGFLKAYEHSGRKSHFDRFVQYVDYAFGHFSDPGHGEWYGYLDREGRPTHRFKGAPYKGFFHVPRALLLCERILSRMTLEADETM